MIHDQIIKKVADINVKIIGFYPTPECNHEEVKRRFTSHNLSLTLGYGVSGQLINHPDEARIYGNRPVVAIQEVVEGDESVSLIDFEHPRDAVYIVGNSQYRWPSEHFSQITHKVHIPTGNPEHPIYGDQVLAIALYDKFSKERFNV